MKIRSVDYIQLSDLKLSSTGLEELSESGSVTFGTAMHTLYPVHMLISTVGFSDESDLKKLEGIAIEFGGTTMIDLEN